ncbi:type IV secretion system protein [Campylobacter sp.]|uniref:virB8 family protein n=1 Tax=Campylobacter sp. TaxID=205 RepID=UPI00259C6D82|nr:type IV secretion system protein [Campylobacter sp.]
MKKVFSKDDIEAMSYNSNVRYLIEVSNKRAWLVSFIFGFIAIMSIIALFLLTPLKQSVPYVIRVDNVTGMVDIISTLKDQTVVSKNSEALDKYFTANYVKLREQYYWDILEQDYYTVQVFSSNRISAEYQNIYAGANSRVKNLQNSVEVEIQIISVVLTNSAGANVATIRFNEIVKDLQSKTSKQTTKVATLTYEYVKELTTEKERVMNPLGFKVNTYRIDSEIAR